MKNRALFYTDVEGGYIKKLPFDIFESEIYKYRKIKYVQFRSEIFGTDVHSPYVTVRTLQVFALFFENGLVMDLRDRKTFTKRPYINEPEFIEDMLNLSV